MDPRATHTCSNIDAYVDVERASDVTKRSLKRLR
jgi:hypothetical protein